MENNKIWKSLTINQLNKNKYNLDYVDGEILLANNLNFLFEQSPFVRLNFFCFILVGEGELRLRINKCAYTLRKNEMCICLPSASLSSISHDDNSQIYLLGFTYDFLNHIPFCLDQTNVVMFYLHTHPVRHLLSKGNTHSYSSYLQYIYECLSDKFSSFFKEEIIHGLFSVLFCEVLADTCRLAAYTPVRYDCCNRKGIIYQRFIEVLSKDNGQHRSLKYYASLLCYTPRYVSNCVKQISGRTPREWVNEHTVGLIKYQLRHSHNSLKEIAELFNFPDQSMLGKFVKKHTGLSPRQYRQSFDK